MFAGSMFSRANSESFAVAAETSMLESSPSFLSRYSFRSEQALDSKAKLEYGAPEFRIEKMACHEDLGRESRCCTT
jgi:hypothetical protein